MVIAAQLSKFKKSLIVHLKWVHLQYTNYTSINLFNNSNGNQIPHLRYNTYFSYFVVHKARPLEASLYTVTNHNNYHTY